MKLYAYAVVKSTFQLSDTIGLANQRVYSIGCGRLAAVVSDFDSDAVPITKDNVLTHQRVVTTVLEQSTPLPFRFGTVVGEQQLISYLGSREAALIKNLELVDGCVEMSIKVIWQNSSTADLPRKNPPENRVSESGGAEFLRSKAQKIKGDEELLRRANGISSWLKDRVGREVRDARFEVNPSQRLVLTAACLVERSRLDSYRVALERSREERLDLHFLTSGPWPPYTFANIDLEFESHFGVS
jgi:hypothetical protein